MDAEFHPETDVLEQVLKLKKHLRKGGIGSHLWGFVWNIIFQSYMHISQVLTTAALDVANHCQLGERLADCQAAGSSLVELVAFTWMNVEAEN